MADVLTWFASFSGELFTGVAGAIVGAVASTMVAARSSKRQRISEGEAELLLDLHKLVAQAVGPTAGILRASAVNVDELRVNILRVKKMAWLQGRRLPWADAIFELGERTNDYLLQTQQQEVDLPSLEEERLALSKLWRKLLTKAVRGE